MKKLSKLIFTIIISQLFLCFAANAWGLTQEQSIALLSYIQEGLKEPGDPQEDLKLSQAISSQEETDLVASIFATPKKNVKTHTVNTLIYRFPNLAKRLVTIATANKMTNHTTYINYFNGMPNDAEETTSLFNQAMKQMDASINLTFLKGIKAREIGLFVEAKRFFNLAMEYRQHSVDLCASYMSYVSGRYNFSFAEVKRAFDLALKYESANPRLYYAYLCAANKAKEGKEILRAFELYMKSEPLNIHMCALYMITLQELQQFQTVKMVFEGLKSKKLDSDYIRFTYEKIASKAEEEGLTDSNSPIDMEDGTDICNAFYHTISVYPLNWLRFNHKPAKTWSWSESPLSYLVHPELFDKPFPGFEQPITVVD